jgi:hypothetical protein
MVVLGRSVAGVSGYSSDKEGAKDATFLPVVHNRTFWLNILDFN